MTLKFFYLSESDNYNLNSGHRKNEFSCGKKMLDKYLCKPANQDIKRKPPTCFVINVKENNTLKGYDTLANNSIPKDIFYRST
jgi:hypothetical protein